jgi:serine/threonine protein kinase
MLDSLRAFILQFHEFQWAQTGATLMKQGFTRGDILDGKYRIDRQLGQGGMGEVYRATHLGTKRTVAVKVIHSQFSNNQEFVERFRREAEAAGRLRHPNVVDVTDFGFARTGIGQTAYLVMEYLDGCVLTDVLTEEGRLPSVWVVDILEQVCSAVNEAHQLGIIHRDLKPDNIWLEPNRRGGYTVKVLDFGLVKLGTLPSTTNESPAIQKSETAQTGSALSPDVTQSPTLLQAPSMEEVATLIKNPADSLSPRVSNMNETGELQAFTDGSRAAENRTIDARVSLETTDVRELTRVGSLMGTPLYMSPEQWRGESVDARSDIYSLGVIAYRMLTGETPFSGTPSELIKLHETGEPPPIREKNSKVPKRMARLVMAALAKNPVERPESAAGFAFALRASVEGSGSLLRQAVSLYSEHFPVFLKISLFAYAPLLALIVFINLNLAVSPFIGALLFLCMMVANLFAYFIVSAVTVPIVTQFIIAPLRPLQISTAFARLKRRWWMLSVTSVVVTTIILIGALLCTVLGILAAVRYVLYAPVVVMEDLGMRATLKRARSLMKRSWSTVLIITILQFALPVLVLYASIDSTFVFKLAEDYSPKEISFNFVISGRSSLYQLLNIFVTPLTTIMTALLYLKMRQAGGESLKDTAEEFEALDIPHSKWQARMRSRLPAQTSEIEEQGTDRPKDSLR